MRRLFVLGVLAATGALSLAAAAYQQPAGQAAPKVVEAEKLKDNLYVMKGGGGNSAVFITAEGVTVVDTKLPGWGAPLTDGLPQAAHAYVEFVESALGVEISLVGTGAERERVVALR